MKPKYVSIAEVVLGKKLPKGAQVHHFDENPRNNTHSNLVICENRAFHSLLHLRAKAYWATGNPNARQCQFCRRWGDPADSTNDLIVYRKTHNLTRSRKRPSLSLSSTACHRRCNAVAARLQRRRIYRPYDPREFDQATAAELVVGD